MRRSKNCYFLPHFCFPWGRPWGNHGKCCMDGKIIRCSQIVPQNIPIYLQQFPSYSNRKCKNSPFLRTAAHIFVSPGDAPAIITQCVARMKRQFNACQTARRMYLSIFNSFRVIRCLSQCVSPKSLFLPHFGFPGDAPGAITLNVVWMEREFDAYKLSRSMYPSIFNSFPVIRTASAKNRLFHVPQLTFLFPLETPLRLSRNMLHRWKDNSMLAKPLAACTYLICCFLRIWAIQMALLSNIL